MIHGVWVNDYVQNSHRDAYDKDFYTTFSRDSITMIDVLFELEKRLDISDYSAYDARVFGFVSERLLDIWIKTNKLTYINIPVEFMEKQNWLVKGAKFLKRKIGMHG